MPFVANAQFHRVVRSSNACIGSLVLVLALLVLSSPAAGQVTFTGRFASHVGNATCRAGHEEVLSRSLLQPTQKIEFTQIVVKEDNHRLGSTVSQLAGRGGQKSIFKLPIWMIDHKNFNLVVAGMLLFTVFVDRGQAYLDYKAEASQRAQAIVARTNSELVMFGVVAVALFVVTNLVEVEEVLFLQVEYVDILCSLTCILLMGIVSSYFMLFNTKANSWTSYEECDLQEGEVPSGNSMDHATYKALAQRFQEKHELPDGFVFSVYLRECFTIDCCDIMNVKWYMWVAFMIIFGALYFIRGPAKSTASPSSSLLNMLILKLVIFLVFILLASFVSHPYSQLIKCAPQLSAHKGLGVIEEDRPKNQFLHFLLQFLSVFNAFGMMHFVMHEIYIIYSSDVSSYWYFTIALPLLNFFLLLPVTLVRMSFVDAFHNSNHEALDTVLTEIHRLDSDMRYIKMLWEHKGKPAPTFDKKELSYEEFTEFLLKDQLGLYVNEQRARRLFAAFDFDQSGTVKIDQFVESLSAPTPHRSLSGHAKTAVFVNIN